MPSDFEKAAEVAEWVAAQPDPTPEQLAVLRRVLGPALRAIAREKVRRARTS